ncbi:alkaline shock response membrane anchor protein AmaP [Streptomyces sp. NPDC058257]|uniref:alkaline shock response membrane anchor protein AmaP n=1 Tax=Streptomyces sp. NPDC058257 TaxID=3346409 RepID=UPI0036EE730E
MLKTVNRVVLGLIGLVLVLGGGSVLAVGLGASPPSWWVHDGKRDVLLSDADRARWRDAGWFWPTVIAVLAVCVLLALWWLVAQLRRRRLAEVLVETGDGEGALLRGRALENVLVGEAESIEGVQRAAVALTGRRNAPHARVSLLLEPHAMPGDALHRLSAEALAHARDSAGLDRLPAVVRLRGVKHRAERVN